MANVLEKVLRVGEGRVLRRLDRYAQAVNHLEDDFSELSDEDLKKETVEFRERYSNGESLEDLLPEAFAPCVRQPSAPLVCVTSMCSSWVARRFISATSPR